MKRPELVSDCCSFRMRGYYLDAELCPSCKEHCTIVDLSEEDEQPKATESLSTNNYVSDFDAREARGDFQIKTN